MFLVPLINNLGFLWMAIELTTLDLLFPGRFLQYQAFGRGRLEIPDHLLGRDHLGPVRRDPFYLRPVDRDRDKKPQLDRPDRLRQNC